MYCALIMIQAPEGHPSRGNGEGMLFGPFGPLSALQAMDWAHVTDDAVEALLEEFMPVEGLRLIRETKIVPCSSIDLELRQVNSLKDLLEVIAQAIAQEFGPPVQKYTLQ